MSLYTRVSFPAHPLFTVNSVPVLHLGCSARPRAKLRDRWWPFLESTSPPTQSFPLTYAVLSFVCYDCGIVTFPPRPRFDFGPRRCRLHRPRLPLSFPRIHKIPGRCSSFPLSNHCAFLLHRPLSRHGPVVHRLFATLVSRSVLMCLVAVLLLNPESLCLCIGLPQITFALRTSLSLATSVFPLSLCN